MIPGSSTAPRQPLAGLKVIELTHIIAGPFTGMLLADHGAEVIKIEPPTGEAHRKSEGSFAMLNRNKKSVVLDLTSETGRQRLTEMIRDCDIFVENLTDDTLAKFGASYPELSEINPRLIYCSIKGFLPGPYENRPLVDEIAQMMGGLAYMTGLPDRPMRAGASIVDMGAAMFAGMGAMMGLYIRELTGKGLKVDAGMFETVALWMGRFMVESQLDGNVPEPMSVRDMGTRMRWEIYDRFKTIDDRDVIIACTSDRHWHAFCQALNQEALENDPRCATKDLRLENRAWLLEQVQAIVRPYDSTELVDTLAAAGVPTAWVNTPADLVHDRHLSESGQLASIRLPEGADVMVPTSPLLIDGVRGEITRSDLSRLGEDTPG